MGSRQGGSGLSKSLILKGLQCKKALWLAKNPPDFGLPEKPDLQAKFDLGTEVGILAQQLFPGGTEVPFEGLSFSEQISHTQQLIDSGAQVIYEASFSFSAIFVKVDILVRDGDAWQIHEVKMGTSVKDVNLDDVAVQHYVLNGCGLTVSKCFLVHIDNSYVRQGAIEVDKLFASEDITLKVLARLQSMPQIVAELRATPAWWGRTRHRHRPALHRSLRMRLHPLLLAAYPQRFDLRPARPRRRQVRLISARYHPPRRCAAG